MDQAAIERLEGSFKLLWPHGKELTDRFYAKLFSEHRQLRELFPEDMTEQKQKLLASLAFVVQSLRKPDQMAEPMRELGHRHVGYGTQVEHYPVVCDTLVAVMAALLGGAWDDQLATDWNATINTVAGIMLEGANAVVPEAHHSRARNPTA